ncbi:MAG: pyridoxamine 5'-phosphate oxidase family protein [Alistipes sp.]|nr:pyridoxamine 5'-phosphate oxidase family protein [Alistipes sp.]
MNERVKISEFVKRHHVLTLATVSAEGLPYCSNAFYAYDSERNVLVFTSDETTRHVREMALHPTVAASIVLETRIVGKIQGLQICGTVCRGDATDRNLYLKRFPYAAAMGELCAWRLEPDFMKLTDNTLGFGKKLIWKKDSTQE